MNETTQKNLWTKSEDIIGSIEIAAPKTLEENLSEIQETPVIPEKISDSSSDSDEPEIIEEVIKEEQNIRESKYTPPTPLVTIFNKCSFFNSVLLQIRVQMKTLDSCILGHIFPTRGRAHQDLNQLVIRISQFQIPAVTETRDPCGQRRYPQSTINHRCVEEGSWAIGGEM